MTDKSKEYENYERDDHDFVMVFEKAAQFKLDQQ